MQISSTLREALNTHIQNTELEYAYIYNIDLILEKIEKVSDKVGSLGLFLDFDVFPDQFTSTILESEDFVRFICSNKFQSSSLRSVPISTSRIYELLRPSEQNKIETYLGATISQGLIGDSTFSTVSIELKQLMTMSRINLLEISKIAGVEEIILKIKTTNGSITLEEIGSVVGFIRDLEIDRDIKIGMDVTSYVFQNAATMLFRVLYTKKNHDHNYAVCSAGTNVLHVAGHGLNPRKHKFKIFPLIDKEYMPTEQWTFTGPLCTPSDVIAIKYPINRPSEGDYYYVSCDRFELYYSPYSFISHAKPKELYYYQEELRSNR